MLAPRLSAVTCDAKLARLSEFVRCYRDSAGQDINNYLRGQLIGDGDLGSTLSELTAQGLRVFIVNDQLAAAFDTGHLATGNVAIPRASPNMLYVDSWSGSTADVQLPATNSADRDALIGKVQAFMVAGEAVTVPNSLHSGQGASNSFD